jgi:two-component system, sensor histidine kinase LadS
VIARLLAALALVFSGAALLVSSAAAAIAIPPGEDHIALAGRIEYLEDKSGTLTIAQVSSSEFAQRFVPARAGVDLNFGYSSSVYWLRVPLKAAADAQGQWLLEVAYASLDSVSLYTRDRYKHFHRQRNGDQLPFAERPYPHRNLVFPVTLGNGEQTLYLRIASEGNLTLPLHLWTPAALHRHDQRTYGILAMYYGALLALAAYNLLLYFSIRDRRYLEYVAFALSMAIGQASLNGLANQFLWPDSPFWGNAVFPAAMAATGFFGALFTRSFLDTRRMAPVLDVVILFWVVAFAAAMVAPFLLPYRTAGVMVSMTGISFAAIAVVAGIHCWRRRAPGARYFLLAWTVLLLGVAVTGARNFGWLPTLGLTSYAMQIGSALEMLLLSFALADRINVLRREKETAQSDALLAKQAMVETLQRSEEKLEMRVAERTRELADSNTRLQQSEQSLRELAYRDNLTGLANRVVMEDRLRQAIMRAERSGSALAVLLLDLDRFKPVNDNHGHAVGDEVLKAVADRIRRCVRSSDTVARVGGDEFVVLLDELRTGKDAERVANAIVQGFAIPVTVGELSLQVSASIGIAIYPTHGEDLPALLREADRAMYQAKIARAQGMTDGWRVSPVSE